MAVSSVDRAWAACTKIVEATTRSCSAIQPASPPPTAPTPNWDALANSFASLSAALAWGALVLALLAIVVGFAWGNLIAKRAENEARTEAQKCANDIISKWLRDDAPGIVRTHLDNLQNASLGNGDDGNAADRIGRAAG